MTKNLSRRLFLLFFSLLSLCVSPAWAGIDWYNENPINNVDGGKTFYIYNTRGNKFVKNATNALADTTEAVLWHVIVKELNNENDYVVQIKNDVPKWFYIHSITTGYEFILDGAEQTIKLRPNSSTSDPNDYYIMRTGSTRYLYWTGSKLDIPGNSNIPNDGAIFYFVTVEQYKLHTAIDRYENAVTAGPSISDYSYLSDELASALNTARSYSFNASSNLADVNDAITELSDAVAAADAYMNANGLSLAEADVLNGWTKMTGSVVGSPSDYYFTMVSCAQTRKLLMPGANGSNQVSYQYMVDPANDLNKTWMIVPSTNGSYGGSYVLRSLYNIENTAYAVQDGTYGPYDLVLSSHANDEANSAFNLVYSDSKWKIQNAVSTSYYWGAWDNAVYVDGERIAGNAGGNGNASGDFHIYYMSRADYISKYLENGNTNLDFLEKTWTGQSGTSAKGYPERYSGSAFVNNTKLMYQTITNLSAGFYEVKFYAAMNRANINADGFRGESGAEVYANDASQTLVVGTSKDYTFSDSDIQSLIAYVGEDGALEYGVKTTMDNGGNWCIVDAISLSRVEEDDLVGSIHVGNVTSCINNPTINQTKGNNYYLPTGWSGIHVSGNGTHTKAGSGDTYLENWNGTASNFDVDYYQVITLPAGSYRLGADIFFNGTAGTVGLYATFGNSTLYTLVNTKGSDFNTYTRDFTLTKASNVRIGVKKLASPTPVDGTWLGADNFTLQYMAAPIKTKTLVGYYGMLYNHEYNILIDNANTQAYYATYDEGEEEVTLHALFDGGDKIIPAGNVVLLKNSNSESSINYCYVSTGTPVTIPSGNCFVHHDNAADASHTDYVLKNEGGVVAFYRFDAACSALDGYNVLRLPIENTHIGGGSAPSMIRIVTEGDNATALVPVYEDKTQGKQINDGRIYTILGVPVSDMSRPGIYIQNGKKYVVR